MSASSPEPSVVNVNAGRDAFAARQQVFNYYEAAPPPSPPVPRQLPAVPAGFTGRSAELSRLTELLLGSASPAMALVTGMAGVGKTALAVHWAHQVHDRLPDGQLYADLNGADPDAPAKPTDVLARFLQALGVAATDIPADLASRAALYRSVLADRRMVVVLDNAASAEQVRPLLPGSGSVAVITSRDTLPGLVARDGVPRLSLDPLEMPDALALLRTLAGDRVNAAPDSAALLVQRCAGLPLALRIVAADAGRPHWDITRIAADLTDQSRLDRLTVEGDPRADVRVVFSWSYRTLEPDVAHLWRALGSFKGPSVTVESAAVLAGVDVSRAGRRVAALVRANLLEEPEPGRYRLHDLLREFAAERAAEDDDEERRAMIGRLCRWYLATAARAVKLLNPAARADLHDADGSPCRTFAAVPDALAWYRAEDQNLLAAAQQAMEHGHLVLVRDLPEVLWHGWYENHVRAAYLAGASLIAVEAARALGETGAEAAALVHLGRSYREDRRHEDAFEALRSAVTKYRSVADRRGEAYARNELGLAYSRSCHPDEAITEHTAALEAFLETGDRAGTAYAFLYVGRLMAHLKETDGAVEAFDAAVHTFGSVDDPRGEATARQDLGNYLWEQDQREEAVPHLDRAAALHESTADWERAINSLNRLGDVYADRKDVDRLAEVNRRALHAAEESECEHCRAASLTAVGVNLTRVERYTEALVPLGDAVRLLGEEGATAAVARLYLGKSLMYLNRLDEAIAHLTAAEATAGAQNEPALHSMTAVHLLIAHGLQVGAGTKRTAAYVRRADALARAGSAPEQIAELVAELRGGGRPRWRRWPNRVRRWTAGVVRSE